MADVKWIKITVDMFDNRKIKHLRRLPDGDSIVLIWVMLLTMAGRCNSGGMIFLTENIPYTPKMLANELNFEEATVQLALQALEQLGMVSTASNGFLLVDGWEEHQNAEALDKIRDQTRKRVAKHRENKKLLECNASGSAPGNVTSNVTVTQCNATEEEREEDKEIDIDIREKGKENSPDSGESATSAESQQISCQQIMDLYNSICKSFPSVRSLSEARRKAIKARLKTYTLDDFRKVFENAEASSFLKGSNDRSWSANFDWLIADKNMAKVLDGNYVDKPRRYGRKEPVPGWMEPSLGEAELEAIQQVLKKPITAGDDPDLAERAERLRREFQGV